MATMSRAVRLAKVSSTVSRGIHSSATRHAISRFSMPAMSPTMTEGGIAAWKVKEGDTFSVGDILLEIETDKATMDVEAQEDGVLGKIIVPDGSKGVPVGKLIALFAEEGDDLAKIEIPAEDATPAAPKETAAPTPSPSTSTSSAPAQSSASSATTHESHGPAHSSKPLFPSVIRLLAENGLSSDVDSLGIKGTGVRGMLTKGDVLTYLGKASGANGTYKIPPTKYGVDLTTVSSGADAAKAPVAPLDADALRKVILSGLTNSTKPILEPAPEATFDSILADYYPKVAINKAAVPPPTPGAKSSSDYLGGLI